MQTTPEMIAIWQASALDVLREKAEELLIQNEKLVIEQERRGMSTERAMGVISALTWVISETEKQGD